MKQVGKNLNPLVPYMQVVAHTYVQLYTLLFQINDLSVDQI
jgi:hypothetical protein